MLAVCLLPSAAAAADPAAYSVRFRGVPQRGLERALRDASEAQALRQAPPPSPSLLELRGRDDVPRLLDVLRAEGYYTASVDVRLLGDDRSRRLVFDVVAGPRFRIGRVGVDTGAVRAPRPYDLGLDPGTPARAAYVLEAEQRLLAAVRGRGYPFPRVVERAYDADPTQALLHVRWRVDPGPAALFGGTSITGLARVSESYVRGVLDWRQGEPFDPARLDETRGKLTRSGLFSAVRLEEGDAVDATGALPIELALRERRRRTVSLGVGYTTDEGSGAQAAWEHRNLAGAAERLRVAGKWAEATRAAEASLAQPQFRRRDQVLIWDVRAAEDRPDAYESRNVRTGVTLTRELSPRWSSRVGAAFRYSVVDQLDDRDDFVLFSLPLALDWNSSNDELDPTRGGRVRADIVPFYDLVSGDIGFVRGQAVGQRYEALDRDRRWVVAGRVVAGAMFGAGRSTIPADERFYAGGGSSIRGYAYQSVGPRDGDDPLGGRSLLEASLELRARLTETLGLVAFADGGTAYAAAAPDFDEPVRWGAGLGFRYFTVVGPLRADVGVPLNPRPDLDRDYQVYISIGQAF